MLIRKFLRQNDGGVTVIVIALGVSFLSVLTCLISFESVVLQQHKLNLQADSVALAAATRIIDAPNQVCDEARTFAQRNRVVLESCKSTSLTVSITIRETLKSPPFRFWKSSLSASARAGIG